MRRLYIVVFFQLMVFSGTVYAQESYFSIHADSISKEIPALNHEIDITVSKVKLQEFLRAVANTANLNMNADPELKLVVTNNFHGVKVKDMLIFLEKNYPIQIDVVGNIVDIKARKELEKIETDLKGVSYDSTQNLLTLDYYKTSLNQVAREITQVSGNNVILAPSIAQKEVNGYVEKMPFSGALEQFAFSNDLKLRTTESGYFVLEAKVKEEVKPTQTTARTSRANQRSNSRTSQKGSSTDYTLDVSQTDAGAVSVKCANAPLGELIQTVSNELKEDYYISSKLEGEVSMNSIVKDYNAFLSEVLSGSSYLYRKENGIFIIGAKENNLLKECETFQFQNRTIDKVIDVIPQDVKEGLLISEFPDLNSLIISGEKQRVNRLVSLLQEIDKTVPVILIEVYIVNVSRNYTFSTGIKAGIGDTPMSTQGTVYPNIDMQFGADGINRMLEGFDGFGVLNIGNVTPNFYLTLKALEEQGILDVNSTPQLSTLNGHEATMKIGETEYYLEETNNFIGNENPILTTSKTYKDIRAELSLIIRPIVSGDDQITLNISVEQSDFTERISNEAPPGSVNRTFESIVRVKNQETIILGGLEEKRRQDSSTGTPLLSRIPVLKWIFSSRTKQTQNSKLSLFIKPTIIG